MDESAEIARSVSTGAPPPEGLSTFRVNASIKVPELLSQMLTKPSISAVTSIRRSGETACKLGRFPGLISLSGERAPTSQIDELPVPPISSSFPASDRAENVMPPD